MKILLIFIALVVISLVVWLVYKLAITIYNKTALRYETIRDVAKVVDKNSTNTIAVQIATRMYPPFFIFQYNVYILYNGEEHCFDDANLYKEVEAGDNVYVLIHNGYNKNGELKRTYLSIEK